MKKIIFAIAIATLSSCKSCITNYESKRAGVLKVCPTCTFVLSEREYYAIDTLKKPNVVYIVRFKLGGFYNSASTVQDLIRVN